MVSGNRGGGIANDGTATLTGSTVSGNTAPGHGGGIANGEFRTLTLNNSTVSGNTALAGAGIDNRGTLTLSNSTVSGNTATFGNGGIGNQFIGTLTISNSTVSGNSTVFGGSGIGNETGGTTILKNTIVANNSPVDCAGAIISAGHNLSSDGTCGFTASGDQQNTNPLLGPLADNGGPTKTQALLPGSPAIDAASPDCPPPFTDQRGVARPQGPRCDIGAFEREQGDAAITATGTSFSATEGKPFAGQTVANFTDPDTMSTAAEYSARIDWGDGSSSPPPPVTITPTGSTSSGNTFAVKGDHTYQEEGSFPVKVTITDVDNPSNTATAMSTAKVVDAALHSSCAAAPVSTQSFSGPTATFTDDNSFATKADFSATINWGDGTTTAGTISGGPGPGPYTVSGSHTYSTTGTFTITTTITDDGGATTTATCTVIVFAFPTATGAFVIGDLADPLPIVGDSVTWWSSQWAQLNPMSGGPAPASMKGFAGFEDNPLGTPRTCGSSWTTDTGNATPPPPSVPAFMGVLVSSKITQNGSIITGNIKQVVVVKTDPGYAPDPGHTGTGTIVTIVCLIL
jgi:hypothetical protein